MSIPCGAQLNVIECYSHSFCYGFARLASPMPSSCCRSEKPKPMADLKQAGPGYLDDGPLATGERFSDLYPHLGAGEKHGYPYPG